jgi:hypothetical protein
MQLIFTGLYFKWQKRRRRISSFQNFLLFAHCQFSVLTRRQDMAYWRGHVCKSLKRLRVAYFHIIFILSSSIFLAVNAPQLTQFIGLVKCGTKVTLHLFNCSLRINLSIEQVMDPPWQTVASFITLLAYSSHVKSHTSKNHLGSHWIMALDCTVATWPCIIVLRWPWFALLQKLPPIALLYLVS